MPKGYRITGVLAALIAAAPAMAQDSGQKMFKFSGFGTLGAVRSSEKNADFVSNISQPNGAGFTRSVDVGPDTRLGLQADAHFSDRFSAVVQVVGEHKYDKTYNPYLNMASLKFQATPELALRAGRLPFAAYLISDYEKVGYSMPWVRPPTEVYEFNPFLHFDGADLTFRHNIGSVAWAFQVMGGSDTIRTHIGQVEGKDMVAGAISAVYGSTTYRAYYLSFKLSLNNLDLDEPTGPYAILRNYAGGFNPVYSPALADQYQLKDKKVTYLSLGWNYDPGDWFLMAEAARNAGDEDQLAHTTAGYLTGGIRFGSWTPYLMVAKKQVDSPLTNANPVIDAIVAGNNSAQSSASLGLRWDFRTNMDLKLQFDRVKNDTGSTGSLINTQPAFKPGESYNLISATLDFVF